MSEAGALRGLLDRAIAAHRGERFDEALRAYTAYLATRPDDAGIWTNLGALYRTTKAHDLALAAQERAYRLDPKAVTIRRNLANILTDTGQGDRAASLRQALVDEGDGDPELRAMIGKALRSAQRYDEGVTVLRALLDEHPDHAEGRVQLALTLLARGDYAEGFAAFQARWETGELTPRQILAPKWQGGDLTGKRILVMPEQGFGDAVAFARFIPVLRQFNPDKVLLQVDKPLARLFAEVEGVDEMAPGFDPGAFDCYVDMMDLPMVHFARAPDVPPPTRLSVPEDSVARARSLTAPFAGHLKVGVVWCGSVTYRGNSFRSFTHRELLPLLDLPRTQLFSLYKGPRLKDLHADGTSAMILDTAASERDFADNAAMMREMDLVVTSCTATAHIAGSLGVETWILLHWDSFWMWGKETDHSPWYPSARLYRQEVPRDWPGVIARVRADLAERAPKGVT